MKMFLSFITALTAMFMATPVMAQMSFSSTPSAISSPDGTVTYDFDTRTPLFTGGAIVTGSTGEYAQPVGSTGNYFAVGPDNGGTNASVFFGNDYALSSVSWIWGSLDGYNSIQFFGDNNILIGDVVTGSMIAAPAIANGDRDSALTNRKVTFTFEGDSRQVRGVHLSSGANALEIDDIVLNPVPEPAAWMMMILGMGIIGSSLRRRQRLVVVT